MAESYRHRAVQCPRCGIAQDFSTRAHGPAGGPEPGDLRVCLYCTAILVHGEGATVRFPTRADRDDDPEAFAAARSLAAEIRRTIRGG